MEKSLRHHAHWALLCAATLSLPAQAGNGLLLTGYGAHSATMSGADIAVADDSQALATNPAGLANIADTEWNISLVPYYALVKHEDNIGNDDEYPSPHFSAIGGGGYARHLASIDAVVGINVIALGGIGYVFESLATPFGNKDEMSATFSILKVSPGIAWSPQPGLRLGATLGLTYATAEQKLFPDTSVSGGGADFAGLNLAGTSAFTINYRLGAQYDIRPDLTLALTYNSPTKLELDGGNLIADYSAQGFGKVRYNDASIKGLELPHEVGAGAAWRLSDEFTLVGELLWLNWNESINTLTLSARRPGGSAPATTLQINSPLNFRNQLVHSIGGIWQWKEGIEIRAGYAYGKNPQPSQTLSPVVAQIPEENVSLGFHFDLDNHWQLDLGSEVQLRKTIDYDSPLFGANASETNSCIYLHLQLGRRF